MASAMIHAERLVGTWRRFGSLGAALRIVESGKMLPTGDHVM